jgi:hypothetical protein
MIALNNPAKPARHSLGPVSCRAGQNKPGLQISGRSTKSRPTREGAASDGVMSKSDLRSLFKSS